MELYQKKTDFSYSLLNQTSNQVEGTLFWAGCRNERVFLWNWRVFSADWASELWKRLGSRFPVKVRQQTVDLERRLFQHWAVANPDTQRHHSASEGADVLATRWVLQQRTSGRLVRRLEAAAAPCFCERHMNCHRVISARYTVSTSFSELEGATSEGGELVGLRSISICFRTAVHRLQA